MKFNIGNVEIKNQVVLAPMAGISNPAYMKICEQMGLDYAVTELISAEAIIRDNQKTFDMLNGIETLNMKVAVQLFGSDENTLAKAAKIIIDRYKVDIIDINMGCPVPKVALKSRAGSALLKDPDKVEKIIKKVSESVDVPVTVKIRSGWDFNSINALEIAKICEKAGAKGISIHPRTKSQGYSGESDWNIIKQVKQNISIPVIGNGDIKTCEDAKKMLEETNCDAVMIGRAALGNPWLIKECINYLEDNTKILKPSLDDKIDIIKKHMDYLVEFKGEKLALLEIRTHISWYLKGIKNASKLKQKIFKTTSLKQINELLDNFKEESYEC